MAAADSSACQRPSGVAGCEGLAAAGVGGAEEPLLLLSWEPARPREGRWGPLNIGLCAPRQAMVGWNACTEGGWSRVGSAAASYRRSGPAT